jgi:hypothetical protein
MCIISKVKKTIEREIVLNDNFLIKIYLPFSNSAIAKYQENGSEIPTDRQRFIDILFEERERDISL